MLAALVLLVATAWAAPVPPASSFGLDAAALERFGYRDLDKGLLELAARRWYVGPAREEKLRELVRTQVKPVQHLQSRQLRLPKISVALPDGDLAVQSATWFDGSKSGGAAQEPDGSAAISAAGNRLSSSSGRIVRASLSVAGMDQGDASVPPVPVFIGALQSRGSAAELARFAALRLPGAGASDLAEAGTMGTWRAVGRLVERYAAGAARLAKPGWEADAAEAYRDGFASAWGRGPVSVTVTDDARLFKNRGVWIGDPVIRRADGSVELVVDLPWMETIAQDGAFGDSRLTRIRRAITDLDGAERTRLVDGALGGRDPQSMTYGLLYRLAGWMQGELLSAAAQDGDAARGETAARVEGHPVWRALYEGALNAASNITRGLGAGLSHPELWKPASDADLWTLVREANAGSASAAQTLAQRLAADSSKIGYAEYLDLGQETNRAAARGLARAVPGACRLSGRLAQQGDAEGIRMFADSCLGPGAGEFLAEAFRRSASDEAKDGYRACVADLLDSSRQRPFGEMIGRHRPWLARVASESPEAAAALYDAAPDAVRSALRPASPDAEAALAAVGKLGAGRVEQAAQAASSRFSAQPQMFLGLLREPAAVEPILTAAKRSGMDPAYLAAVAFQEGFYLYADALAKGDAPPVFTSRGPMGLDSFGDLEGSLKRSGYLRQDFSGAQVGGDTWLNEAGHRLPSVAFKSPEDALEAMAALLRYKKAQFERDAKSLGIKTDSMSAADRELWTYVYYNFRDPRSILAHGGLAAAHRYAPPDDPLYNDQRVAATAEFLRELGIFGK